MKRVYRQKRDPQYSESFVDALFIKSESAARHYRHLMPLVDELAREIVDVVAYALTSRRGARRGADHSYVHCESVATTCKSELNNSLYDSKSCEKR